MRCVYLAIGIALIAPYGTLAELLREALEPALGAVAALGLAIVACFVALPLATGMLAAVRELEIVAARRLLSVRLADVEASDAPLSWSTRWRGATWFVLHVVAGGLIASLTLTLPAVAIAALRTPFSSGDVRLGPLDATVSGGPESAWIVPLAALALLALVYFAAATSALLAAIAPRLLGPSPAERLVALQRHAAGLAQRNRLARELHDSVGHALSIVTVQSGAAGRVLDSDPAFARRALSEIESSARSGLRDLDHVLGLLRDDGGERAPTPTLADLQRLVDSTRSAGIDVTAQLRGSVADVPQAVSREAYRIVQESLTNVARHAGQVPVRLTLIVGADDLELDISNPLGRLRAPRAGGGSGQDGIRERVAGLRGHVFAGQDGDRWRVCVRLPLRPAP